ncbi:MAG: Maf family protein [Xanthobacteraceae bacterium]
MSLWLLPEPLVLASRSAVRRAMLGAAGIPVEVSPADVDERAIETEFGSTRAEEVAALLARSKAMTVAARMAGRIVLGADQTLALDAGRFSKPAERAQAREQLLALRGRTHTLYSAVAIVRDGTILHECIAVARLTMRSFSDEFLERYLDEAGQAVTASVGAYQLERIGIHLFDRIEGDHFTILGLPLLALLAFFRQRGFVA